MSKVLSRFNWPVIVATVMVARFLLQQTSTSGSAAGGVGVGGMLAFPAAIHESIRSGLGAVAPAPWDHVVLGVSSLLVVAAWARWLLGARP